MLNFEPGRKYSRPEIKETAGLPKAAKGGPWDTGIVGHDGEFLIFANVGVPGRTGHNYDNRWEHGLLRWYHRGGSRLSWPSVQLLLEDGRVVHVFCRNPDAPYFEYAGRATAVEVSDTSPVEILWSFEGTERPDEIPWGEYQEGAARRVTVNAYERDRGARQACIDRYGTNCTVCDLRFEDRYGPLGAGFIHVHHLIPLSEVGVNYKINPLTDLRPICPNCHAMVHRRQPPLSIEELRRILHNSRNPQGEPPGLDGAT